MPRASRLAVLVNPANARNTEITLRDAQQTAHAMGFEILVLRARDKFEIDAAFGSVARERADALLVGTDVSILGAAGPD